MQTATEDERNNLKSKLKMKISDQSLRRSSKIKKETLIDKNLKKLGVDKEKLKNDIEALKAQGGFTDEQMQQLFNSGLNRK